MSERILIGTSGWSYDEWTSIFYPKNLKKKNFLSYYSKIFHTNEINSTFYRIPSKWIVKSWVDRTPDDFTFTAKLPKTITHNSKLDLEKCYEELDYYLAVMEPLITSKKLTAFLIQLPPSFNKKDHFKFLKEFIVNWPTDYISENYHLVVEFRNKSWMNEDVFNFLREYSLTYCSVIEPLLPPRMDVTNDEFLYIRFHGFGDKIWFDYLFNNDEINKYGDLIKKTMSKTKSINIYFNNHFSGYAIKNSFMMMKKLGLKPRNEPKEIQVHEFDKIKYPPLSKDQTTLDKFFS